MLYPLSYTGTDSASEDRPDTAGHTVLTPNDADNPRCDPQGGAEHPRCTWQDRAVAGVGDMVNWTPAFGPEHPAGHGPMEWQLQTDLNTITWAEPLIYPIHRGAEKLFESRDYSQIIMLANRHDWHSAFASELGLVLTIESMLGLKVPQRATWIRTLLAELNRAIHHLRMLGETARELTEPTIASSAKSARELLIDAQDEFTGGRMHTMIVQPGRLRADTPDGSVTRSPALRSRSA